MAITTSSVYVALSNDYHALIVDGPNSNVELRKYVSTVFHPKLM